MIRKVIVGMITVGAIVTAVLPVWMLCHDSGKVVELLRIPCLNMECTGSA